MAEQISNRCRHFTGLQNKQCAAGVVYVTVESKDVKGFERFPCFRQGESIPCDKRSFPTPEEVAAKVAEREASWERLKLGIIAASDDAKKHGYGKGKGGAGRVQCPVCKTGELHYSVAGYNGHMHGRCSTKGCLSWMQ